jgi:hypothetical protein
MSWLSAFSVTAVIFLNRSTLLFALRLACRKHQQTEEGRLTVAF